MRALPAPEPTKRITSHPFATPLHRIRTENMLPSKLLTSFQVKLKPCPHSRPPEGLCMPFVGCKPLTHLQRPRYCACHCALFLINILHHICWLA